LIPRGGTLFDRMGLGDSGLGDVVGRRQPVALVDQAEFLGFAASNLVVDVIKGNSANVPEGTGAGSIGIEKEQGTGLGRSDLEVEACHVLAVERLDAHGQGDVTKATIRGLGNERGWDSQRFP
jgi:hypothetical protein